MHYGNKDKKPFGFAVKTQPTPNQMLEIEIKAGREPVGTTGSGQEEARRIVEMLSRKKGNESAFDMPFELLDIVSSDPLGVAAAREASRRMKEMRKGEDSMKPSVSEFLDFEKLPQRDALMGRKKYNIAPAAEVPDIDSPMYRGKDDMLMPGGVQDFLDLERSLKLKKEM